MLELTERIAGLEFARLMAERRAIAADNYHTEFKAANGFGTLQARMSMSEYFGARAKYGEDCWDDPEFTKAYLRDNPELRVKTTRSINGNEYAGTRYLRTDLPKGTIFVPPSYATPG